MSLKYAESMAPHDTRFYGNDPHDGPTPMDFFVWAAVSPERTVAIDCGFTAETAARRGRRFLHTPAEGLRQLGIASETIRHVILTHFHNDQSGTSPISERELCRAGPRDGLLDWPLRQQGRLPLGRGAGGYSGSGSPELRRSSPLRRRRGGDRARESPCTTSGGTRLDCKSSCVETARGRVVLASDAVHYYANIEEDRPFRIVSDLPQMYDAFETIRSLADSPGHVIPGHDPLVLTRYPAVPDLEGIAARLA